MDERIAAAPFMTERLLRGFNKAERNAVAVGGIKYAYHGSIVVERARMSKYLIAVAFWLILSNEAKKLTDDPVGLLGRFHALCLLDRRRKKDATWNGQERRCRRARPFPVYVGAWTYGLIAALFAVGVFVGGTAAQELVKLALKR